MAVDDFLSETELRQLGLRSVGRNVLISRHALLFSPERISIGDHSRIDAFCVLSAGVPHLTIGRNVHVSAHVVIVGRGAVEIGDFATLSVRTTIFSSTDDFSGEVMIGPTLPDEYRRAVDTPVIISAHSGLGAGSIVLPGITIGESGTVAAASLVTRDVPPFTVVGGRPARRMHERSRRHRELADQLLAREAAEQEGSVSDPDSE